MVGPFGHRAIFWHQRERSPLKSFGNTSKTREPEEAYEVLRLRAYPTDAQSACLERWLETLRWLYNRSLAQRKDAYKKDKTSVTHRQQRDALVPLKRQEPKLKEPPSQVVQDCLSRLQEAYGHFFRRLGEKKRGGKGKVGVPKFKKYGRYSSLTYTQVWLRQTKDPQKPEYKEVIKLRVEEAQKEGTPKGVLVLPKLGELKVKVHREFDWQRAKRVTLKKMPNGHWYACICFQIELPEKKETSEQVGGVDVGLKNLTTTSDENYTEHPKFFQKSEEKLKKEQRKLSKKKKGSKNWERQRKQVAKVHHKIAMQRLDFLHKLSLWLVLTYDVVVFEGLNIPAMVRDKRFAKSILDAGWGALIDFVSYKSVRLGHRVVKVDPAYTSQDCSECGRRVPKALAERVHKCPCCGVVMCRDVNAAKNVKKRAGVGLPEPSVSRTDGNRLWRENLYLPGFEPDG